MSPDWRRQGRLSAVIERVRGRSAGFVGARMDVAASAVWLYWHREVPPEAAERARAEADGGVVVELRTTPYALDELTAEAARVLRTCPAAVSAGPNRDYDGLRIGVNASETPLDAVRVESRMPVELMARGRIIPIRRG
ncbi:hypothetical protein JOF41_003058 [Saccharothrix coeruleofusca]|uniref:hypothetical protein n=1 Tax=Saccharothrix coeruleofusca TaxID=33919 RepID=UPI001AE3477B|nr:hypothetical protein [Saccharothrix coeruleofusca]MBP2336880.1 hypothetical protein [Saccharothrix coeruleofusca]